MIHLIHGLLVAFSKYCYSSPVFDILVDGQKFLIYYVVVLIITKSMHTDSFDYKTIQKADRHWPNNSFIDAPLLQSKSSQYKSVV